MLIAIIIFSFLALIFLLGAYQSHDPAGYVLGAVSSSFILCLLLVLTVISRHDIKVKIQRMESVRHTLTQARLKHPSDGEMYAITHEIAESNAWLAGMKWDNSGGNDILIPDEIMDVMPIE